MDSNKKFFSKLSPALRRSPLPNLRRPFRRTLATKLTDNGVKEPLTPPASPKIDSIKKLTLKTGRNEHVFDKTNGVKKVQTTFPETPCLEDEWNLLQDDPSKCLTFRRHMLYIGELEAGSEEIGSTVRAIYDGDEHEKFMERLDARIKNHDRDIERMCNHHYQGFIESIRELLQVRTQAQKLQKEVMQTDEELQSSCHKVVQKSDELVKYRKIQYNVAQAIDSLRLCQPVLEMYAKLIQQMSEKRYYSALKTLEQLEHTYLPQVSRYRFAHGMGVKVPHHRERIKDASMTDLKDFLENIRKVSPKIGEVVIRHASEQKSLECGIGLRKKKRKAPPPPNPFTGEVDLEPEADSSPYDGEEDVSPQDMVDFSPVYRCLHIYTVLGAREGFETYYRQQRKQQCKLSLQPPTNMQGTIEGYKDYFSGIVGFFVVEDHILTTANGLVNRPYLDEMWENALSTIIASLRTHLTYCSDSDLVLKIKRLILLFSYTLKSYGYQVGQLHNLLLEVHNQYNQILMKQWEQVFQEIFEDDNYHPIQVENQAEYAAIVDVFPYHDVALRKAQFPKKFPFSQFVPKIYVQVKEFIYACLKFSEDLSLSQTEVEDMVRKSTNLLLTQTLSDCLSTLIRKPNLGLLQLIQITINTNYLEDASASLEDFIFSITGSTRDSSHVAKLQSLSVLKNARAHAQEQIYQQLNEKIDEFLELANYDWLLSEPQGQASSYLTDLIAFLNSTFQAFTNLPDKLAQTACMSSCKHIAQSLMELLTNIDIKFISIGALHQFNLDVIQCEQFASSEPVKGFHENDLLLCFADLRQLLDLVITWDWSTYFHDYGLENSKYLRVSPYVAIALLEKVREADKKKNLFSVLKKNERDKKKLVETVLKQLQQLTNGTS